MKIKVENLKCFDEVAKVIGVANAKRELFIALHSKYSEKINLLADSDLTGAFKFRFTNQGYDFWRAISKGENPYAN